MAKSSVTQAPARQIRRRIVELPFDPAGPLPMGFGVGRGADPSAGVQLPELPLLKSHEVAERLGVKPRWVTDKLNAGHLTGYRLPGSNRLRFSWPEVMACLERSGGE